MSKIKDALKKVIKDMNNIEKESIKKAEKIIRVTKEAQKQSKNR